MSTPQLVAIVPAEDLLQTLVQADRRFSLHRVLFDLYSPGFPARVPQLVVTLIFCGGAGEYEAQLSVTGPAGATLMAAPFTFTARTYHLQAVNLGGLELPEPGQYTLTASLEGRPVMNAPLTVIKLDHPNPKETSLP